MTTKLASALPKDDQANGLNDIAANLVDDPTDLHVAVVVLDCSKITTDIDTGDETPTARVRRIEIITRDDDKATARSMPSSVCVSYHFLIKHACRSSMKFQMYMYV